MSVLARRRLRLLRVVCVGVAGLLCLVAAPGCEADDATPPIVAALTRAGLPPSSLDYVPTVGAPSVGAPRAPISVVAFVDPTDPRGRRCVLRLLEWATKADDVRLAVRLFSLPETPNDAVARGLRSLEAEAFFEALAADTVTGAYEADAGRAGAAAALVADVAEARRLRVDASPTVFVNGFRLTGAMPTDNYRTVAAAFRDALASVSLDGPPVPMEARLRPYARPAAPAPPVVVARRRAVLPEEDDPWLGAEEPLVTIMFFADLECAPSRQAWTTLKAILRRHQDVQVRFKHRPTGASKASKVEARAAIAASVQGDFWRAVDYLFERTLVAPEDYRRFARALRLDRGRFERDRMSKPVFDKLDADRRAGDRLGPKGAPLLAVNGVPMVGRLPRPRIEDRVAVERARAKSMLAAGVDREELQVETVRRGAGMPAEPAPLRRRSVLAPRSRARSGRPTVSVFVDPTCRYTGRVLRQLWTVTGTAGAELDVHFRPGGDRRAAAAAELLVMAQLDATVDERVVWRGLLSTPFDLSAVRSLPASIGWRPSAGLRRRAQRRLRSDAERARAAGVIEVPAVFVDGRPLDDPLDRTRLEDRIAAASADE